jgi:hypothetical protein
MKKCVVCGPEDCPECKIKKRVKRKIKKDKEKQIQDIAEREKFSKKLNF